MQDLSFEGVGQMFGGNIFRGSGQNFAVERSLKNRFLIFFFKRHGGTPVTWKLNHLGYMWILGTRETFNI